MKNIDFLPDIYRQRRVLQHARLWWVGVATLFGLSIGAMAATQFYFRCELQFQLQRVEPQFILAQQQKAEMARIEAEVKEAEELAALYLYLGHPWPRTQLLAAVATPLPPSIQLVELRLVEESASAIAEQPAGPDANRRTNAGENADKPSARTDLANFRGVHDRRTTTLELSGRATNIKELHEFVDAIAKSPLVKDANLKGLASGGDASASGAASFNLRIAICPGHGQAGGPAGQGATVEVASAETPGNTGGAP